MATKRVPLRRSMKARITPEVVELWRRCVEIQDHDDDEFWERDGGRRREYLDAHLALDRLLGLPPWAISPLDCNGPTAPRDMSGTCAGPTWAAAWDLRQALEAAAARERVPA